MQVRIIRDMLVTMSNMIGYMVTWTTYGSWLQGDNRGYVKDGKILPSNQQILLANRRLQRFETIKLNPEQRAVVHQAILDEAKRVGQKIDAIAVCEHHVHIVARPCRESIPQIVSRYKNVAMFALCKNAQIGRVWTRGFDKRFCFTEEDLKHKIDYVRRHSSF